MNTDLAISKGKSTFAPHAKPKATINLSNLAASTNITSTSGQHEQSAWQLASILFGDLSDSIPPVSGPVAAQALKSQVRKEKLSEFWQSLVQQEVETAAQFGRSPEEKAFLYLTGGNIPEACAALLSGVNFHLAQMISQLPGDQTFRDTLNNQIEIWRKRSDWPEMNDAIRALYEILSGEVCECRGLSITGQENKASSFKFSTRYRYDWRRAFGLRLWYGTLRGDDIAQAVLDYSKDLAEFHESAMPAPWFLLRLEDQGWADPEPNSREDVLWSLLKLYTNQVEIQGTESPVLTNIETMFAPESISGYPYDARLSFQLLSTLKASKSVSMDDNEATKVLDNLAFIYADALESQIPVHPELLITAAWVLLHLSNNNTRTEHIRTLLDKHANLLNPDQAICKTLIASDGLQIPYVWVCSALAKHAETVENDTIAQARWLIEGGELIKAHDAFCHRIGPEAVISLDYNPMREIVRALVETDISRKVDWDTGAGLYSDFLELIDLQGASKNGEYRSRVKKLVKKLASSLEALSSEVRGENMDREEKIALKLMAEEVLDIGRREKVSFCTKMIPYDLHSNTTFLCQVLENENLLKLPLTESGYLKQSMAISVNFYQALMLKA
jgi:nuclear pore complex protein Nup98-Nup96